jgi:N-acyl-D-aspartate/D-glutamate deacylase
MALVLLLEDDGQIWTAPTTKSQDDMDYLLGHPLGVAVVDRPALAPYGVLGRPTNLGTYGTFPRVLGRYAREWGVLPMETAVQKVTSIPAQRMGLTDRGLLRPGLHADITVFDPETVVDRETFQDSHAFPDGIEYVIVNGELVVEQGTQHEVRPGKVL